MTTMDLDTFHDVIRETLEEVPLGTLITKRLLALPPGKYLIGRYSDGRDCCPLVAATGRIPESFSASEQWVLQFDHRLVSRGFRGSINVIPNERNTT